jgi:hypothetical protein
MRTNTNCSPPPIPFLRAYRGEFWPGEWGSDDGSIFFGIYFDFSSHRLGFHSVPTATVGSAPLRSPTGDDAAFPTPARQGEFGGAGIGFRWPPRLACAIFGKAGALVLISLEGRCVCS